MLGGSVSVFVNRTQWCRRSYSTCHNNHTRHYSEVKISAMASQITSLTIVNSSVYSGADQIKDQSSAWLAFVRGIHRWPVNYTHKGPVTRKMYPFYDVIMVIMTIRWLHLATETHWLPLPKSGLTISHVVALHVGAGLLTIPVSLINITILANQVLNTRFIITVKLWF